MRAGDAISDILEGQGRSQRSLAKQLDIAPQTLSRRLLGDGSLRVDTLATMVEALGYRVVIEPISGDGITYEIDR